MCKFNQRLFVFLPLLTALVVGHAGAAPTIGDNNIVELVLNLLREDNDYDLHYDQRQKGDENFRLKMDGFFIGVPPQESSANDLLGFTDELLDTLGEEYLLAYEGNPLTGKVMKNTTPEKTIILEIPAPKKDAEARNRVDNNNLKGSQTNASRTRMHIYHLLNFLRKTRKN